jgi:glycosyltransferase involved in cell wall biosynthesis|tara:strand:+ start:2069 stop:2719 length:651 start_codon:yes stop_codon:yes gene_type:complete
MKFSVIIRNRNEERFIGHCIQSVVDFLGDEVQIVIVDNESTDNSIRIANTFDYLDIKEILISKNDYTPGKSLNLGIKEVINPYTLILSAHCEITKFNSDSVIEILEKNNIGGVWGKQIPIWDGKRITRRYMWSNFTDDSHSNYWCELEDRYFFHNAFSMFRTEHLMEYPFDERLSGKEDRYWANNQIEKGYKIFYDSQVEVKHHYTEGGATWKGVG